ncbi:MAG TPA: hypothetical protein VHQ41_02795 [Patescibacteria group bacterium]|jgi:hypothetical protein|nr:hypothetical protein [Patescibacteria group bacterium]
MGDSFVQIGGTFAFAVLFFYGVIGFITGKLFYNDVPGAIGTNIYSISGKRADYTSAGIALLGLLIYLLIAYSAPPVFYGSYLLSHIIFGLTGLITAFISNLIAKRKVTNKR